MSLAQLQPQLVLLEKDSKESVWGNSQANCCCPIQIDATGRLLFCRVVSEWEQAVGVPGMDERCQRPGMLYSCRHRIESCTKRYLRRISIMKTLFDMASHWAGQEKGWGDQYEPYPNSKEDSRVARLEEEVKRLRTKAASSASCRSCTRPTHAEGACPWPIR